MPGPSRGAPAPRRPAVVSAVVSGLAVAGLLGLGAGCGPVSYLRTVPLGAAGAVAQARHLSAERLAPYELTAAEEYLHKARELAGYSRFEAAVALGRKADEQARLAQRLSVERAALPAARRAEVLGPAYAEPPPAAASPAAASPASDRPASKAPAARVPSP